MCHKSDIEDTIKLMTAFLEESGKFSINPIGRFSGTGHNIAALHTKESECFFEAFVFMADVLQPPVAARLSAQ